MREQVLLDELSVRCGNINTFGNRILYASQEAWITSSSVRDNILFGSREDTALFDGQYPTRMRERASTPTVESGKWKVESGKWKVES